jgi:dienelactone hydrolase
MTPTTTVPPSGPRAYAEPGPYPVGVVEVPIDGGRPMTVWYPATPGSEVGVAPATYDMRDFLPSSEVSKLAAVPVAETSFTMNAYPSLPPSEAGPFPLVLFSHGFSGYRTQSTFLTTTLASWGFVVAAPEHASRDLVAVLTNTIGQAPTDDVQDLHDAITTMERATAAASGPLVGLVDTDRIAAVGHSAGGGAVFRLAAEEPRVRTYVALAAPAGARPGAAVPSQPSLFVAGTADVIAKLDTVETSWNQVVPSPKRLAVLDNVTHLGFMDVCTIARDKGGVLQLAASQGIAAPPIVVGLFADGCDPKYTDATDAWPAIDHLTVAQVRYGLGIDQQPVGLDASVASAYPPMPIRFEEG